MREDYYDYLEQERNSLERNEYLREKLLFERQAKLKRIRNRIISIISLVVLLLATLVIILYFFIKKDSFLSEFNSSSLSILGISAIALTGTFLMKYLQTNSDDYKSDKYIKDIYLDELSELKYNIEVLKNKTGKGQETEKNISMIIDEFIKTKFSDRFIQERIESNYKDDAIKNKKINNLINYIENNSNRLDHEILRLRKSANLNLVIGTLSTFLAIFCLVYEVFYNEISFSNNTQVLSHYIPRVSLVIFIEIFAFFFLKLYKSNLYEIKYFNNEKTNIDFKIFSLKTAIYYEDKDMINNCINSFINTERNFIIKKDESTIDLEKHKHDTMNNTDLKELILGLLKNKNN